MKENDKTSLTPLSELISLKNKRALITGSGTGIGEAIASARADNVDAAQKLLETGFEYICSHNGQISSEEENRRVLLCCQHGARARSDGFFRCQHNNY